MVSLPNGKRHTEGDPDVHLLSDVLSLLNVDLGELKGGRAMSQHAEHDHLGERCRLTMTSGLVASSLVKWGEIILQGPHLSNARDKAVSLSERPQ